MGIERKASKRLPGGGRSHLLPVEIEELLCFSIAEERKEGSKVSGSI
jgi:hypothetical protein